MPEPRRITYKSYKGILLLLHESSSAPDPLWDLSSV